MTMPSVWATGNLTSRAQRMGRYLPASMDHPAKMLPAIASQVIATYTQPGDLVLDPMCGIGTTLVEAIHLGREAVGVEYEARWANLAVANLLHAHRQGATGTSRVIVGDSRRIRVLLGGSAGRVALVLTSPPYGSSTHGHIRSTRDSGEPGIKKWNHRYSHDPGNLAHRDLVRLMEGFGEILTGCRHLLRPGGIVAITIRPIRVRGELIDLPGQVLDIAEHAGLILIDRIAALLCGVRDDRIVSRASFFQLQEARRAQARGIPVHAIAHEDLLIFTTPTGDTATDGDAR
ncbi:TRM11 family SAM-dependent methyltransferase [Microtetraspora malaysiensis]|uniref:TRM11 family SAM-dependent methyltransferase n=1 Tax=Microtetraspora malaysiensis TaxID=161358 RepID=UPI000832B566|nr:DNA methyltransferase [Microtetraspora malaysiensis]